MTLKDKLVAEGLKLAGNPQVAKLMQDPRFMGLVMSAMAVPGRVSTFTSEQKEQFAKTMGLATVDEMRSLRRAIESMEDTLARLEAKLAAK